jgi:aminomuconate-semialdehyde/2-hydroxymuconate-6-semialdehyde dehydrogenase
MKAGADGVRPVSLELGGKNAAMVFADCDFQVAVDTVTRSVFENCGQVCLGTERVYVERPIFDRFVAALKAKGESMTPGRPDGPDTKIGPLVSQVGATDRRRAVLDQQLVPAGSADRVRRLRSSPGSA